MKKSFKRLLISALFLFTIVGCTTQKEETIEPTVKKDKFRTFNTNRNSDDIQVICTNCRAQFKISLHAMKSGASVKCPICKHHYRTGQH